MSRKPQPLKKKYGKLTVLSERIVDARRVAEVECTCGVVKDVLADALRSGRAQSCGALLCRVNRSKVKADPTYKPRGPSAITVAQLKRWYPKVTQKDPKYTSADVARKLGVSYNTIYSVFRNVRKAGGLAPYLASLES